MTDEKIKGGCILISRHLLSSKIWKKPPEYLKIFIYILLRVNYKDELFPRGSNFFNFSEERIWGVSKNQIYEFLRWAKSKDVEILTTEKTTRGIVVKINNYDKYQDLINYKLQDELQLGSNTIIKERKKDSLLHKLSNEENFKKLSSDWWELFKDWLDYKKAKKQSYKNERSLRAFINKILRISQGDLLKAKDLIEESMANNWSGVFERNNSAPAKQKTNNDKRTSAAYQPYKHETVKADVVDLKKQREKINAFKRG